MFGPEHDYLTSSFIFAEFVGKELHDCLRRQRGKTQGQFATGATSYFRARACRVKRIARGNKERSMAPARVTLYRADRANRSKASQEAARRARIEFGQTEQCPGRVPRSTQAPPIR
jgi:hypothetical protein